MTRNKWKRLGWTAVQAFAGSIAAAAMLNLEAVQAAVFAAFTAVAAAVTLIARGELGEDAG